MCYILLGILIFFAIILSLPVSVSIKYIDDFVCNLFIGFLKIQLYPQKPKSKKKKPKKEKNQPAKTTNQPPKKKKNLFQRKGIEGVIEILQKSVDLANGVLKHFFKHTVIKDLKLSVKVAGNDAGDTALKYGAYCSVIYPLVGNVVNTIKCKKYGVDIMVNFEENAKTVIDFNAKINTRIFWLVKLVLKNIKKLSELINEIN